MPDFYLASTELREPYEPRACRVVKRLRSELRDDLALVEVEPPLHRQIYGTDEGVRELILAARHEGTSMFPITEWPLAVYVCRPKRPIDLTREELSSKDLAILVWGELRKES